MLMMDLPSLFIFNLFIYLFYSRNTAELGSHENHPGILTSDITWRIERH
jgi:hypothetical protein